jgi:hypothetical protein
MLQAGTIDPTKFVQIAPDDAASIAGLLTNTVAMVTQRKKTPRKFRNGFHARHDVASRCASIRARSTDFPKTGDAGKWRINPNRNQLTLEGNQMSKGDRQRGNREVKKPKKAKEKVAATADFSKGKTPVSIGGKKKP